VTAGPESCPLCGRRGLIDQGYEGVVCAGCASAFEVDRATGLRRYTRVSPRYQPIEARLLEAWLSGDEVLEAGRSLSLQRARWLVALSAAAIVTVGLFTCALGSAFALAPGIRDSQARLAVANPSVTGTLTLTPTVAGPAPGGAAPTVALTSGAPLRSPSPTVAGPLTSPLPTPGRGGDQPTPPIRGTTALSGTPGRPAPIPTQGPAEATAPVVLPPTFTPAATLRLTTPTLSPTESATSEPISPTATVTDGTTAITLTPTPEQTSQVTSSPTATPTRAEPSPTATPTPTATSSAVSDINYQGTPSLNEADEFVELRNSGETLVAIQGWTIRHRQGTSRIALPPLTLLAGQTCRIYTAPPAPSGTCGPITFGNSQNLWPNDADTLQLLDASSLLVSEYAYPQPSLAVK
jgi:hypothetical protein